jgi:hypothetical protein
MKQFLTAFVLGLAVTIPTYAADKKDDAKPETRKVCVDVQGKDGKPVMDPKTNKPKQQCKEVKAHQKHEATKIEDAKKDAKK